MPKRTLSIANLTKPIDSAEVEIVRPTRLQEIIRQWIMLIPLTTAAVGSAAVQMVDEYPDLLPTIFFVGALLVTTAMVHQRRILQMNLRLTERVQAANSRMDTLHRLSLELNTSLNAAQVGQTVLEHTLRLLETGSGALWVSDQVELAESDATFQAVDSLLIPAEPDSRRRDTAAWRLLTSTGYEAAPEREELWDWKKRLEADELNLLQETPASLTSMPPAAQADLRHHELSNSGPRSRITDDGTFVVVPVSWKGKVGAVILIRCGQRLLDPADAVLLDDIALLAGPALQNALMYQSAAERAELDGSPSFIIIALCKSELCRKSRA
jgi:hypothetical protein